LPRLPFLPRLRDYHLRILIHQRLKRTIVLGILGDHRDLLLRHVATDRLAVLAALQVVVRPTFALADHAELSWLHALNFRDLVKKSDRSACVVLHNDQTIYIHI